MCTRVRRFEQRLYAILRGLDPDLDPARLPDRAQQYLQRPSGMASSAAGHGRRPSFPPHAPRLQQRGLAAQPPDASRSLPEEVGRIQQRAQQGGMGGCCWVPAAVHTMCAAAVGSRTFCCCCCCKHNCAGRTTDTGSGLVGLLLGVSMHACTCKRTWADISCEFGAALSNQVCTGGACLPVQRSACAKYERWLCWCVDGAHRCARTRPRG